MHRNGDLVGTNGFFIEKKEYQKLDKRKLFDEFQEMRQIGFQHYFQNATHLNDNEKAILFHVSHIFNTSEKSMKMYISNHVDFFNYVQVLFNLVTYDHINDYINYLKNQKLTINTINFKLVTLKSFYSYMVNVNLTQYNPAAVVRKLKGEKHKFSKRVLSIDELQHVLLYAQQHMSLRNYLIVLIFYITGVRHTELQNLVWKDFFKNIKEEWHINIIGKGGKERDVYVPDFVMQIIMTYRHFVTGVAPFQPAPLLADMPVFASNTNLKEPLSGSTIYRTVKKAGEKGIGKKISPHWLRHSFATHARLQNATLEQVKQQLGHSSINTTMIYEHSAHLKEPAGKSIENIVQQK